MARDTKYDTIICKAPSAIPLAHVLTGINQQITDYLANAETKFRCVRKIKNTGVYLEKGMIVAVYETWQEPELRLSPKRTV